MRPYFSIAKPATTLPNGANNAKMLAIHDMSLFVTNIVVFDGSFSCGIKTAENTKVVPTDKLQEAAINDAII